MKKIIKVPIIMASSMKTTLPTEDVWETVKDMYLLDDILKVKGHPKQSTEIKEKPYTEGERLDLIVELMNINTDRVMFERKATYVELLMEHKKYFKADRISDAESSRQVRPILFNKRLQDSLPELIKKPPLFKGKGKILLNKEYTKGFVWTTNKKLVNLAKNIYKEDPYKLGEISTSALKIVLSRPWPPDRLFDVVEEWKEVPFQVLSKHPLNKGELTWKKYSNSKKQVRIVIDNCRY